MTKDYFYATAFCAIVPTSMYLQLLLLLLLLQLLEELLWVEPRWSCEVQ